MVESSVCRIAAHITKVVSNARFSPAGRASVCGGGPEVTTVVMTVTRPRLSLHAFLRRRGETEQAGQRTAALGIDPHVGTHAGAQVAGVLVAVEGDAERHTLHHLDPVAA